MTQMTAQQISARITEIEAEMSQHGFFSDKRKALEREKDTLIAQRNMIYADERATATPNLRPRISQDRRDLEAENAVTAANWWRMHQ